MSAKPRLLSAARPCASVYQTQVNGNQGGGMKKGGLPGTTSLGVQFALRRVNQRAYSSPAQRRQVFCMNQIGGIGAVHGGNGSRTFAPAADGVKKPCFNKNKK